MKAFIDSTADAVGIDGDDLKHLPVRFSECLILPAARRNVGFQGPYSEEKNFEPIVFAQYASLEYPPLKS